MPEPNNRGFLGVVLNCALSVITAASAIYRKVTCNSPLNLFFTITGVRWKPFGNALLWSDLT